MKTEGRRWIYVPYDQVKDAVGPFSLISADNAIEAWPGRRGKAACWWPQFIIRFDGLTVLQASGSARGYESEKADWGRRIDWKGKPM